MIHIPQDIESRQAYVSWLKSRLGDDFHCRGDCAALAILRDNQIAAVAIYQPLDLRGLNFDISFAADTPRWATRQTFRMILETAFSPQGLRARRLTALTRANNHRVNKLLKGMGFRQEGTHPGWFGKRAAFSWGMTADRFNRRYAL